MAEILPRDLDAVPSVNPSSAIIVDDGNIVGKGTPLQVVDAARPKASQVDAEAGADNEKIMTPLRVKQAIDALGVTPATLGGASGAALVGKGDTTLDVITPLTPEQFGAIGDDTNDDTVAIEEMLTELAAGPQKRAVISKTHRTTRVLVIPYGATIDFGETGKIRLDAANNVNCLDCSAGGFHLINPHLEGPGGTMSSNPPAFKSGAGIGIYGSANGVGVPPTYVQGGVIDGPRIYGFHRSGIETQYWENGVINGNGGRIHDCGYNGVGNLSSKGFRGYGPLLCENIGLARDPGTSAYGHTNTRWTGGGYGPDLIGSPRSVNVRVYGWTGRNIPWNAFDSHGGDDIQYIDCTAEECLFPFGLVGDANGHGIQRSGLIRPIIRNDPNGPTFAKILAGDSAVRPSVVIQGIEGGEPAQDCFIIDPTFEYTGQDVTASGTIRLVKTDRVMIRNVRAIGCTRHLIAMEGGATANTNVDIDGVYALNQGSNTGGQTSYAVYAQPAGGVTGQVRNVVVEQNGDIPFGFPISAQLYFGNTDLNQVEVFNSSSSTVQRFFDNLVAGQVLAPARAIVDLGRNGATAGWALPAADTGVLLYLPSSQTGATRIIPVSGLRAGDILRGFYVMGRAHGVGSAISAQLVRTTPTATGPLYTNIGPPVSFTSVTNAALGPDNMRVSGLTETIGAGESYYVLLTGTTLSGAISYTGLVVEELAV